MTCGASDTKGAATVGLHSAWRLAGAQPLTSPASSPSGRPCAARPELVDAEAMRAAPGQPRKKPNCS
eukprot:4795196-Pyramimonas_sp.AAC.1